MTCPSFTDKQSENLKKAIRLTNKQHYEISYNIEGDKNIKLTGLCRGDKCSVIIKHTKKQTGTFHTHPADPNHYLAPSPDDSFLAWIRQDKWHCIGGEGKYFDEKLDVPTTRCFVSSVPKNRYFTYPGVEQVFEDWMKAKERSDKAIRPLKGLALEDTEKKFEKLGKFIQRNIYTKKCEYEHK